MSTKDKKNSFTLWPYAIVVAMVLFMSYIAMFVYKAMNQDVDLVSKDYYEKEIKYQDQIDRVKRTQALGDVIVEYKAGEQTLLLQLPATYRGMNPSGTITLFRPSDDKLDKQVPLQLGRDQSQLLEVSDLASGIWKVRVSFNADNQEYYTEKTIQIK
ncbi:FixH family protein [Pontibacter flavimaris]|uniref:Nitrogen fixation protein FixH n=1 Tax=Pontibacter flavimaris TaxID=1797110 RepID=A0A1Q5PH20_9BACT|nr:FixH family protein [Pontibacter flavimaris]OKL41526.1 nitrogen fixation protein FixH [Pontibacter flavimaris]